MPTTTVKAKGTLLEYGNADAATSTTWTALARVKSIKPGKRKVPGIDTTVLVSNSKEQIPGLPEAEDYEAVLEYATTQTTTIDAFVGIVKGWRLRYPDDSGRRIDGWIGEMGEESIENGGIITQSVKIMVSGLDVYDPTILVA